MTSPQFAPAGSSQYTSDTLYVGDGTWDTQRNTFLLPNLVGLNFDTMRYNGMGNRFRGLRQYRLLIRGHGVVAAITFLLIVPAAIITIRFYAGNPRRAVRIHIWLQILTVLLSTAVFALGWLAVGPNRSLTNPHHGIGLAIYVLILAQAIGGAWVHHKEKKKRKLYAPLSATIHHWIGRAIALLGLAQVPLGLTLYGSPRVLFVLYALVVFVLLVTYFVLSHRHDRRGNDYDSRYSYGSGSAVQERRRSSGIGGLAAAGAAGIGIAALANRFRHRSRSRGSHPEVVGSRRHSGSFIEEEKYSRHGKDDRRQDGWKDKLIKVGAIAGALALVKQLMGSKNNHDRESDVDEYASRVGGASTVNPHVQRMEEGRPLPGVQRPLNQPGGHRRSTSSLSYSSYTSAAGERRRSHGLGGTVAGLGALGLARNIFRGRRERKEQRRLEAQRQKEIDNERRARAKNQRYTGDGYPHRNGRRASVTTSTDLSASTDDRPRYDGGMPPPVPAGVFPAGAAGAAIAGQSSQRSRQTLAPNPSQPAIPMYSATAPLSNPPILPGPAPIPAMPPGPGSMPPIPTIPPAPGPALVPPPPAGQVSMPPVPPDPQGLFHPESSGSEAYVSPGGRNHRRHSGRNQAVGAAAGAAAGVTAGASSSRQDRHHSGSGGSVASPPVSVKVKMHSDGRHVTLRRLPEEEAAAERQRRSKDRHGKRRRGSFSSLGEPSGGSDRWRRTGTLEQQQAEAMRIESENLAAARNQTQIPPPQNVPMPLPPPPPIPGSSVGPRPGTASVGSPGTYDGEVTEASADYANNRRRRRAERAQAKQAREARMGSNVDFS